VREWQSSLCSRSAPWPPARPRRSRWPFRGTALSRVAEGGTSWTAVFLTVEEVADRYRTSPKAIHDRTRTHRIPYVKRQGFRRLLFPLVDLEAWNAGAVLELVELPDGRAAEREN